MSSTITETATTVILTQLPVQDAANGAVALAESPATASQADIAMPGTLSRILSQPEAKDLRAYEYARQQVRKVADRKTQRQRTGSHRAKRVLGAPAGVKDLLWKHDNIDAVDVVLAGTVTKATAVAFAPSSDASKFEAKLADLIVAKKPRTRRRAGGFSFPPLPPSLLTPLSFVLSDSDFEIIPHMRSVIVLDDTTFSQDMALGDEPWEHIYDDKDEGDVDIQAPTYATVLSAGK